jgi:hypothetical protein
MPILRSLLIYFLSIHSLLLFAQEKDSLTHGFSNNELLLFLKAKTAVAEARINQQIYLDSALRKLGLSPVDYQMLRDELLKPESERNLEDFSAEDIKAFDTFLMIREQVMEDWPALVRRSVIQTGMDYDRYQYLQLSLKELPDLKEQLEVLQIKHAQTSP